MIDLDTTTKKYIRPDEVKELFDSMGIAVSRRTIYYWLESGKLPSIQIGGSLRIPIADLRKILPKDPPSPSWASGSVQSVKHI